MARSQTCIYAAFLKIPTFSVTFKTVSYTSHFYNDFTYWNYRRKTLKFEKYTEISLWNGTGYISYYNNVKRCGFNFAGWIRKLTDVVCFVRCLRLVRIYYNISCKIFVYISSFYTSLDFLCLRIRMRQWFVIRKQVYFVRLEYYMLVNNIYIEWRIN